ncbi:hypothetical protein IKG45_02080 [Candidatus Saccharibacteria bacterium]|nr:hypothetical protein [Candidatus Saccharibacteria bacterium]
MNTDELINAVKKWGAEKGIDDPKMQMCKLIEELGEMNHELTRGKFDSPEMKDAIGDTLVVLIIEANILGYDVIDCLRSAYDEIKERKGKTINGAFVKEV